MDTSIPQILIVEDEELLLQAICKKMESAGVGTVSTTTGKQALDYLNSLPKPPDLIWLDYYLKDMTGLEFMGQIHNNPSWSKIPILVVSNSASEDKVHHMLALGATKYLLKAEYRLEDIINLAKQIIKNPPDIA